MTNIELILALLSGTIEEVNISTNIPDISKKGQSVSYRMTHSYDTDISITSGSSYSYNSYTPEEAYRFLEDITGLSAETKAEPRFRQPEAEVAEEAEVVAEIA